MNSSKLDISRKDVKLFVMCIPYGKRDNTYKKEIFAKYRVFLKENFDDYDDQKKAVDWFLQQVKNSIESELPGIYSIQEWLQEIVKLYNQRGKHMDWPTWVFTVRQRYLKTKIKRIEATFYGKPIKFTLREQTNQLDKKAAAQGVVANFIHNIDAAALMETVCRLLKEKVFTAAAIHDCFGARFGDIEVLEKAAREGFIQVHLSDLLPQYHRHFENTLGTELPPMPKQGNFDIKSVEKALYAFS